MNVLQGFPARTPDVPRVPALGVIAPALLRLHWERRRALYPSAGHCESEEVQVELEHGSVAKLLLAAVLLGVHVLEHQHEVGGKGG